MTTHPLALPFPGSLSCEEELQRLHDVTAWLNRAIPALNNQRAIARNRVNALRSATQGLSPLIQVTALPSPTLSTSTHPFALPPPGSLSRGDEIQRLHDVTVHISRVFPTLLKQRAIANSRVNALRSATRGLSSEILSIVFNYACTLTRLTPPPLVLHHKLHPDHFVVSLAGVSLLWRRTILSSPQLWSHIRLGLDKEPTEGRLNLLLLYLERSGMLDLDIAIFFHALAPSTCLVETSRRWLGPETLVDPSVDAIIVKNLHRIRSLHLEGASIKWLSYAPHLTKLSRLTLSLNYESDQTKPANSATPASFTNSPYLHELSLAVGNKCFGLHINAYWSRITILNLTNTDRGVCLDLLALCSNIEEYGCTTPYPSRMSRIGTSWSSSVIRPSLKRFSWSMLEIVNREELLMLKNLHVPSLERLKLHIVSHGQQPNLRQFCHRLPLSVKSISLHMICCPNEKADSCILEAFAPTLRTKDLHIGCLGCVKSAHHALHWMLDPDFLRDVSCFSLCGTVYRLPSQPAVPLVLPLYCSELVIQVIGLRVRGMHTDKFVLRLENIRAQWTPEKQGQLDAFGTGWELHV